QAAFLDPARPTQRTPPGPAELLDRRRGPSQPYGTLELGGAARKRRECIVLLGGAAVSWPFSAHGQQRPKVPRLGVLLFSTPQADPQMAAVHSSLRELGYVEGQNIILVYRYAEGKYERLADLAANLVSEKPDLLLALGGDVAPYAAKATL